MAASGVCGASCSELELKTAAKGCCFAQKRQRHGGRFVVLVHGAVIQNLGFLGVLRRSCCVFAPSLPAGGVARWCGLMLGRWRRCRRGRRARRDSRCDFGAVLERRSNGAAPAHRGASLCAPVGHWRRCGRCRALRVQRALRGCSGVRSCAGWAGGRGDVAGVLCRTAIGGAERAVVEVERGRVASVAPVATPRTRSTAKLRQCGRLA